MNRTAFIKNMQSKKRKRAPTRKLKIRWEVLGLSAPQERDDSASIDSIRQAVSSLASRGIGQGVRARAKNEPSEEMPESNSRGIGRRETAD
ncbi:MAG: hypothetical protein OEY86_05505 [Nitrospira sp.]|nr:hypothetical protein [Nitrospira sp.]